MSGTEMTSHADTIGHGTLPDNCSPRPPFQLLRSVANSAHKTALLSESSRQSAGVDEYRWRRQEAPSVTSTTQARANRTEKADSGVWDVVRLWTHLDSSGSTDVRTWGCGKGRRVRRDWAGGLPMKKLFSISALAAGAALALAGSANAADMPVKAAPPPVPVAYDWSGLYVGSHWGYSWATVQDTI